MINRLPLPVIERVLVLLAALCLMLAPLACNSGIGVRRSCESITDDILQNITDGGIDPSQATICRGLELTLESFDAGCTVAGGGTREFVVQQIETECGG